MRCLPRLVACLACLAAVVLVSTAAAPARALTLQVGPGRTYTTGAAAIAAAGDGDVIEIDAGRYAADIATIRVDNLTIRGLGGFAHLDAAGATISNGKAIWVQQGRNLTVESIEMSGASVPDQNGAGIRIEADGLTVRGCYFHDNENGILGGSGATNDIVIENSEFANNGFGDGFSHNIYISHAHSLTVRGSWFHHARIGHELKSRAGINVLLGNRFSNEDGTASYEVDLPEGGLAIIVGNVIQQGDNTDNSTIVSFAAETQMWPTQELYVVNNTIVNDRAAGGTFVRYSGTATVVLRNNLFIGGGTVLGGTGGSVTMDGNLAMTTFAFADRAGYDYHLTAGSPAIDVGVDPGMGGGMSLTPALQYHHPSSSDSRMLVGAAIDVGAFEHGSMATGTDAGTTLPGDAGATVPTDGGATPGADGGTAGRDGGTTPGGDGGGTTAPADDGGCSCRVSGATRSPVGALAALGGVALVLASVRIARRRVRSSRPR